jgi:hypothetical protein
VGLTQNSQTDVDRHVDQGLAVAAGGSGLVTLGLAKSSHTGVNGDIDETVGGALLLALSISNDASTEAEWHANQAFGSLDALCTDIDY